MVDERKVEVEVQGQQGFHTLDDTYRGIVVVVVVVQVDKSMEYEDELEDE